MNFANKLEAKALYYHTGWLNTKLNWSQMNSINKMNMWKMVELEGLLKEIIIKNEK